MRIGDVSTDVLQPWSDQGTVVSVLGLFSVQFGIGMQVLLRIHGKDQISCATTLLARNKNVGSIGDPT